MLVITCRLLGCPDNAPPAVRSLTTANRVSGIGNGKRERKWKSTGKKRCHLQGRCLADETDKMTSRIRGTKLKKACTRAQFELQEE